MAGAQDVPAHDDGQPTKPGAVGLGQRAWRKIIGYNDCEANRLGVPYVSSKDWLGEIFADPKGKAVNYFDALFPFTKWILSYNSQWAIGDIIAGITVGLVLVPQSMSYAKIATVDAEYGLYSSFIGVMIYALFATSKDVTIGPVAVMSLQTANVIRDVTAKTGTLYSNEVIASALAFMCGVICLGIGLLRVGWIIEFIPTPAVSGFMTGSAITIAVGQVPKLMGIPNIVTNGPACYRIVINTLKGLPNTTIDAAFGLTCLAFLYAVRSLCNRLPRRYPKLARTCFFISVLRNAFVIIIATAATYAWLKDVKPRNYKKFPISVLGPVPGGFQHVGAVDLNPGLLGDLAGQIPVSVIVLLLEHIAISKSFGRLNNYKINPNQELIAIGVTNLVGPNFGAYAATGSFSRSAIKSKSGVRTPLAGWITGVVVIIALFALTDTFFWIPNAALSAVIIHAVGDLVAPPALLYKFWLVSPFELFIFLAAVFVTVFSSVENGVYTSVAASLALLLIRIARPRGTWLGTVRVHYNDSRQALTNATHRDVFVPLDDKDGLRDPSVRVDSPPPGILIYRFEESFTYPNASHLSDIFIDKVRDETRPGTERIYKRLGDRPWNDPGPINPALTKFARKLGFRKRLDKVMEDAYSAETSNDTRPILKAIIFDFSAVSNVDTTSVQCLADVRQAVERYKGGRVEFYFASITSPWIRRALLAAGFGTGSTLTHISEVAPVVSPHDNIHRHQSSASSPSAAVAAGDDKKSDLADDAILNRLDKGKRRSSTDSSDIDSKSGDNDNLPNNDSEVSVPVIWNHDLTPFFHLDLSAALAAATGHNNASHASS